MTNVYGFPATEKKEWIKPKTLEDWPWEKNLGKPHIDINAPLDSSYKPEPPINDQNDLARYKDVDMVNHPPHYTYVEGIECIDFIEHMPYLRGAAGKYIFRAGRKEDEIEDLEKAIWCLQREVKRLRKEQARDHGC